MAGSVLQNRASALSATLYKHRARRIRISSERLSRRRWVIQIELVDGGYCANNPTLYGSADAVAAMNYDPKGIAGC